LALLDVASEVKTMIVEPMITFCILHVLRLDCTKRCIDSINKTTKIPFKIILLNQGDNRKETTDYFEELDTADNIEIISLLENIGGPQGRNKSITPADTPFIVSLDNDAYLQKGWLEPILKILENSKIVMVGIPLYNREGELTSHCGRRVDTKRGILRFHDVTEGLDGEYVEVDINCEGAMVFRQSIKHLVNWDPSFKLAFGGFDMNLRLLDYTRENNLVRVVSLKSKCEHWQLPNPEYKPIRMNHPQYARDYNLFCKIWKVRFPLKKHLTIRYFYPLLSRSIVNIIRWVRRKPPLIWIWKPKVL
jgi:glycosyltransferase involved in cell wall biosynthesis